MPDRKLFLSFPLVLEPGGFSLIHKKRERKKRKKARDKILRCRMTLELP